MTPEAAYPEVERLVKKFKSLSAAERALDDRRVYELYGLTEEEIGVVEGRG